MAESDAPQSLEELIAILASINPIAAEVLAGIQLANKFTQIALPFVAAAIAGNQPVDPEKWAEAHAATIQLSQKMDNIAAAIADKRAGGGDAVA